MMLSDVLKGIPVEAPAGDLSVAVTGMSSDSTRVTRGDLFAALRGARADGRTFIPEAVQKGAAAVVSEEPVENAPVPCVRVPDLRARMGDMASRIYGEPGREITLVGVTGTNGKTTTCLLIEAVLRGSGKTTGYIGTLAYRWGGKDREAPRTTPEAPDLQRMLRDMKEGGVRNVVMECSSHGIALGRLGGLPLDVALFTNLTQDHLDFHGTMEEYARAKWRLFSGILEASPKLRKRAVFNLDDATGREWAGRLGPSALTYSLSDRQATVSAERYDLSAAGIEASVRIGGQTSALRSPLVGAHNLSNLLGALAAAHALGFAGADSVRAVEQVTTISGRLERVPNGRKVHVFVDYAHTDDALKNVLDALRPLTKGRLIAVFGCGGDRDRLKRPKMARVTAERADVSVLTSDNPRSEKPETILGEMEAGLPEGLRRVGADDLRADSSAVACSIADRRRAIGIAARISRPGDIVLIAGKGHETWQEISGTKHPFDDRMVARECFGEENR